MLTGALLLAGCMGAPFGAERPTTAAQIAGPTPASAISTGPGYPNINAPPPPQTGKLLTPAEKERAIAELEALARKQGSDLARDKAAADSACDNLSAEELRKKMLQGQC